MLALYEARTSPAEIAKIMKKRPSQVSGKLAQLRQQTVPPGEITTYVDEQGQTITKCPPGYARGVYASNTVGQAKRN